MTISPTEPLRSDIFIGNGTQTVFPLPFTIFDPSEVAVEVKAGSGDWTPLVYGADYVAVVSPPPGVGGSLTLTAPLTNGMQLVAYPNTELSQRRAFSNQSALFFNEVEQSLDKLTALLRQTNDLARRAVVVDRMSTVRDLTLPEPQAGRLLIGTDAGWTNGPNAGHIEAAESWATAAEQSATAAEQSATAAGAAVTMTENQVANLFPSDFLYEGKYWRALTAGSPGSPPGSWDAAVTFGTHVNFGPYIRLGAAATASQSVMTRGVQPYTAGRTIRITVTARNITEASARLRYRVAALDSSFAVVNTIVGDISPTVANVFQARSVDVELPSGTSYVWLRAGVWTAEDILPDVSVDVARIEIKDVTDLLAVQDAAASITNVIFADIAALLASTASISVGTKVMTRAEKFSYSVVSSDPDLTTDGGVMLRVLPDSDGFIHFNAWNPDLTGTTDMAAKLQQAVNRVPASGGTLVLPDGNIRVNSQVHRKLNAGGANGWGFGIVGAVAGNTTILVGHTGVGIFLEGPDGTFASGVKVWGVRFEGATVGQGIGLRVTGVARSDFSVQCMKLSYGMEVEAFLINNLHIRAEQCRYGLIFRKSGHLAGAWGNSGCNENVVTGDFGRCTQWGWQMDTCRGVTADVHVERNGDEDIAGGGVADTDRGGIKIIDPVGTFRLRGSSEDNGDIEGANSGPGALLVFTTGAVVEPWTVDLQGWNFFGTLDRPQFYITVTNNSAAGRGILRLSGVNFSDHPTYTPVAGNGKISVSAPAKNVTVIMDGVNMTFPSEMTYNANTDYVITNSPGIGPDAVYYAKPTSDHAYGQVIEGTFTTAALKIDGNQKISLNSSGERWLRWNSAANAIEFGTGLPGSEVVKHTFSMV